jgi:hypothetical protein
MKTRYRVLAVIAAVGGGIIAVVALTSLSTASQGPLSALLERTGSGVAGLENRVRTRLGGTGRRSELSWFDRFRSNAALLRHPSTVLLGAYDGGEPTTLEGVAQLERTVGVTLPLIQFYTAWGDKPEQQFPAAVAAAIWDYGSAPLITWEPWLSDFESSRHPNIALRDVRENHGLAAVARGEYDFYVDTWAADAARFGHPVFVRLAHEMNDPYRYPWGPQHDTKEEFIAAWRHVVDRFRLAGATNVIWVWSPHVAYEYWEQYYPGSDYVDWVATGTLNYGPLARWTEWWTFDQIFGTKYPALASFKKPVMVAEFGSLAVGGDRAAWYRNALANLPKHYPAVRALLFFNASGDQSVSAQKLDWTFAGDSATGLAVRTALVQWAPGPRLGRNATTAP